MTKAPSMPDSRFVPLPSWATKSKVLPVNKDEKLPEAQAMETREGGDVEQAPSRSDDSAVAAIRGDASNLGADIPEEGVDALVERLKCEIGDRLREEENPVKAGDDYATGFNNGLRLARRTVFTLLDRHHTALASSLPLRGEPSA